MSVGLLVEHEHGVFDLELGTNKQEMTKIIKMSLAHRKNNFVLRRKKNGSETKKSQ